MANSFTPFFLPLLFILTTTAVLENIAIVKGDPDLTFISNFCGAEHDVNSLRKDQARRLADGAAQSAVPGGAACGGTWEQPYMYYRATCSAPTSPADCAACITYAGDQVVNENVCDDQYGAQITFVSCSLRFETYQIAQCPPQP